MIRLLAALSIFAFSSISFAQLPSTVASGDLVVIGAKIDSVMQPKGLTDTLHECVQNATCKVILDGAAAYVGVDSSKITSAAAMMTKKSAGETSYFDMRLPEGYQYCRSKVKTISVVPATGNRASFMIVNARPNGLVIQTWTPKRHWGQGRSWVEADLEVTGVKKDLAAHYQETKQCLAEPLPKEIINCRGSRGVNHGQKACTTFWN